MNGLIVLGRTMRFHVDDYEEEEDEVDDDDDAPVCCSAYIKLVCDQDVV